MSAHAYGESLRWEPESPRIRVVSLVVSWIVAAAALGVAAWLLPGVALEQTGAAFAVAAVVAVLNGLLPPLVAALRLPFRLALRLPAGPGHRRPGAPVRGRPGARGHPHRLLRRRDARRAGDGGCEHGAPDGAGHRRRRRVHDVRHPARRPAAGRRRAHRRAGDRLPGDRRARPAGAARRDARRQRAHDGELGRRGGLPPDRVGDRPLVPDRREPGRHPARLKRGHPGVSLGGEGARPDARLLLARRLRGDRAALRDGRRAADRRRRQPRQPALGRGGRGHPHRQPDGGREGREPRLSGVPRERLQRHALARAVRLGGRPRGDRVHPRRAPRRAAARAPGRDLPADARRDVRDHPRPGRLRRAHGHDARAPRGLRDVRQLRRGGPPLGPRARRHHGGAAQARPPVRPHRARPALRAAALRDRGALRSRADPGRHVQAAPRLRARRARRALDGPHRRRRRRGRRRADRDGRARGGRGQRTQGGEAGQERRLRPRRGRPGIRQPGPRLPDGGAAAAHARGDRRAPSGARAGAARPPAHRVAARAQGRRRGRRARPERRAAPQRRRRRGRGPARALLADGVPPPPAHGWLPALPGPAGGQLLRPGARRGVRVRGADLLPRRPRRPADAPVRPGAGEPARAGGAADRRRGGARAARRLAAAAPGPRITPSR